MSLPQPLESPSTIRKVDQGDNGLGMLTGEYVSMSEMYKVWPKFVPIPVGCGTYASNPNVHFFLCEFIPMTDEVPEIQSFTQTLAELHSGGISPNGKYGFHVLTYKGTIPQYTDWHDTWEGSFTTL